MPASNAKIHPITGCRMDTILGDWLMEEGKLQRIVDMGWAVLENGDLQAYSAKSATMHTDAEDRPFTVNDGMARFAISGPMTKYDTSMSSVFGGTSTMRLRESLGEIRRSFHAGMIKGVFIDADSGGGTVDGTAELAAAIRKTAEIMPVFVHAEDTAASACLWAATQGTRFTCGPVASVGSLGIKTALTESIGDGSKGKPVVITTGKYKDMSVPGKAITPEHRAEVQRLLNEMNEPFKADVAKARRLTTAQLTEVATARIFIGADAKRVGLVDAVCTTDDAYEYAKKQINTPAPARRGPGTSGNNPAAPRSSYMPLPLEQLRKLPGAAHATEDNAEQVVMTVAEQLHSKMTAAESSLVSMTAERDVFKAKLASIPAVDPAIAKIHLKLAEKEAAFLVKQGYMSSAQMKLVCDSVFKTGDEPNLSMFTVNSNGKLPYESILAAYEGNKPNGIGSDVSKAQPAAKTEPGTGAADIPSYEQVCADYSNAKLPPPTVEQYKVRFGVK